MVNNFYHYISPTRELYIYGSNRHHSLGLDNESIDVKFDNKIWLCSNVSKVSFGKSHTAILTMDGFLYVMGDNSRNQIGIDVPYTSTPHKIKENIFDILCNDYSTLFITKDGVIGEFGDLLELQYHSKSYITKKLTPYERYNFIASGKQLRIMGVYNIFDDTQRFLLEGNYESYNQPGYNIIDFLTKFKPNTIKKILIYDNELFVLDNSDNVYYYGKYIFEMRCTNSETIIMRNIKDITKSRDNDKIYAVQHINGKDYILSRVVKRGERC